MTKARLERDVREAIASISGQALHYLERLQNRESSFETVNEAVAAAETAARTVHLLSLYLIVSIPSSSSDRHSERSNITEGLSTLIQVGSMLRESVGTLADALNAAQAAQPFLIGYHVRELAGRLVNAWILIERVVTDCTILRSLGVSTEGFVGCGGGSSGSPVVRLPMGLW